MILEKNKYYLYSEYGCTIEVVTAYKGTNSPTDYLFRYIKDKKGKLLSFDSKDDAVLYLNQNYEQKNIDLRYRMPPKPLKI